MNRSVGRARQSSGSCAKETDTGGTRSGRDEYTPPGGPLGRAWMDRCSVRAGGHRLTSTPTRSREFAPPWADGRDGGHEVCLCRPILFGRLLACSGSPSVKFAPFRMDRPKVLWLRNSGFRIIWLDVNLEVTMISTSGWLLLSTQPDSCIPVFGTRVFVCRSGVSRINRSMYLEEKWTRV